MKKVRSFVAGEWAQADSTSVVLHDVYEGRSVAEVHLASRAQVMAAVRAVAKEQATREFPPFERFRVLAMASELVAGRASEFIETIVTETGFTVTDARREVERAAQTLLLSAEEAKRITGEVVPLDADPTAPRKIGYTVRRPVGVVCAITPFNSPLNTVAHKVAPALAAGNGVVLKPAVQTPLSADLLLRVLLDAGLPERLIAVLYGPGKTVGQWLIEDEVPGFYAFTGSTEVGRTIQQTIGVRRSQLELGSLSSTIVCADADIDRAVRLCSAAAFRKAGQVCTSIQRLYIDRAVQDEFVAKLRDLLATRSAGDPRDPETFVGPLISPEAADRVESWIEAAVQAGATIVCGGARSGAVIEPTVLTNVAPEMNVMCREIFGPVVSICTFADIDSAIGDVNSTPYGLSAGLFTADIGRAFDIASRLRMGSVHINDASSARIDMMPFGGVKASGFGREGPAFAIREMTDEVLITVSAASDSRK